MKIFVGSLENCGVINALSIGFKNLGHEVTSFVKQRDPFFENVKYDFDLSNLRSAAIFKAPSLLRSCELRARNILCEQFIHHKLFNNFLLNDIFVFTGSSILRNQVDLALIKSLGKKIVFIFLGSELRNYDAFNQQYPDIHLPWPETHTSENLNSKLKFIRHIEYYADTIHALPDIDGLLLRSYYPTYLPFISDDKPFNVTDNKVPKIIHAPSNKNIKGTVQILEALQRLRAEGVEFDFSLVDKMPNQDLMLELLKADILVDQIFLHYPSMISTEGMAVGCAVAINSYEDNPLFSPPVCNINEHNLYSQLKMLILDRKYRLKISSAGREFVKYNSSPEIVAGKILDGVLQENAGVKIHPTFFAERFINSSGSLISKEVKKMTREILKKYFSQEQFDKISTSLKERNLL